MTATIRDHVMSQSAPHAASPLRVAILLGGLGVGGAETQAIALAAELQRDGHTIALITLADGPLRATVESHRLALHVLPRIGGLALTAVPGLTRELSASKPQVVYAFLEVQWLLALAAATVTADAALIA